MSLVPVERPSARGPVKPNGGRPAKGAERVHVELRRAEVERLELLGYSERRMAAAVGIAKSTLRDDLSAVRRERREWFGVSQLEDLRIQEWQRLEQLRADLLDEIDESLTVLVPTDPTTGEPLDGRPAVLEILESNRDYRLRARRELRQVSASTRLLLGLDAPMKLEHSGFLQTDLSQGLLDSIIANAHDAGVDLTDGSTDPTG